MRVGGRFRFGHTRRERPSPWCDQSATHPSQKAAKDGAPTVWFGIGRLATRLKDNPRYTSPVIWPTCPLTMYIAGIGASWWSVGGQLLTSVVIVLSVRQDLGSRARIGAALGSFMAIVFCISALVTAIRVNLRGGAVICAVVLGLETWLILWWILHRQSKRNSP